MGNPFAIGIMALGVIMFVLGASLILRRAGTAGIVLSLLGLAAIATPFVISFSIGPNP